MGGECSPTRGGSCSQNVHESERRQISSGSPPGGVPHQAFFIFVQRRPEAKAGSGGKGALKGIAVEGEKPTGPCCNGGGHQHKVMAARLESA